MVIIIRAPVAPTGWPTLMPEPTTGALDCNVILDAQENRNWPDRA
jgi:hypothetical protein